MSLTEAEMRAAREALQASQRTLILHDDDGDGACAYAICAAACADARSVPVKNSPVVTDFFVRKVEEHAPDLVVVLDKPRVAEEFLSQVRTPILWLDHHESQRELTREHPHVTYLNPRNHDPEDGRPTSYWAYRITGERLWLAVLGTIADWHVPEFLGEFEKAYPGILPEKRSRIQDLYLDNPMGTLIRVLQFNLKGTTSEVRKSIQTFARITDPNEILQQSTARGKFVWKKYLQHAGAYDLLLKEAIAAGQAPGKLLLFRYEHTQSYTAELSNELLIRFPGKVIIVGRSSEGKMKCSARSTDVDLPKRIQDSLSGLDGYGGGHAHACGIVVSEQDWAEFLARFEKSL